MLDLILFAFGDVESEMDARARSVFRLDPTDSVVVLAILVVVASLLFFWAFYVRKRPREKHGVPIIKNNRELAEDSGQSRGRARRKRRRHHPDNFPRNPTLGETGGLPPLRPEEESVPPEGDPEPPPAKS